MNGLIATPVVPLVRILHRKGHDVSIYCLDQNSHEALHLKGERLSIHLIPKRRARFCMTDAYQKERSQITEAITREQPDVLSAQWSYEHAMAALDTGIPTAVTCHDTPLRYAWNAKNLFMLYHMFLAGYVIRKAQHLVAVSPYTAKHIEKYFKPRAAIKVIPNGLPDDAFLRGQQRMTSRPIPRIPFTICSIGNWGRLKNIKALLRAYSKVRQHVKDSKLVLIGKGLEKGGPAHAWARRRSLENAVEFRGSMERSQVLDFLQNEAHLMVHPSTVETHGMVLAEAMACGVPVIGGSHSGAVPWTLDNGKSGSLCDIHDIDNISQSILHMINNPDSLKLVTTHAWQSAKDRFSINRTVDENERLLRSITSI